MGLYTGNDDMPEGSQFCNEETSEKDGQNKHKGTRWRDQAFSSHFLSTQALDVAQDV